MSVTPPARHGQPVWPFPSVCRSARSTSRPSSDHRALVGSQVGVWERWRCWRPLALRRLRLPLLAGGRLPCSPPGSGSRCRRSSPTRIPPRYRARTCPTTPPRSPRAARSSPSTAWPVTGRAGAETDRRPPRCPAPAGSARAPRAASHRGRSLLVDRPRDLRIGMPAFADRLSPDEPLGAHQLPARAVGGSTSHA